MPLAYGATREATPGYNTRDPFGFDTRGKEYQMSNIFNHWFDDSNLRLTIGENSYMSLSNLFINSLWNVDAVSFVIKAAVRTTVREANLVMPMVYTQSI